MKVHIDFETRSTVDIWETGAWIYSAHPSTRIQCIAYAIGNGPVQLIDFRAPDKGLGNQLCNLIKDPSVVFVAHNAFFERSIWANIMVKHHGFPPIPIKRWRCTQAKALAYGLPKGLEKSADALEVTNRKNKIGRQIMLRMAKPLKGKTYDEDPEHYKILFEYCKQDVEVERELDNTLPDLSPIEQEIWFYDQLVNTRGLHVDMKSVKKFIKILENKTESLNKELVFLTDGAVTKGTQVQSMLNFLNAGGAGLTELTKYSVATAIKENKLTPKQLQILRLRQQLGKSSLAKYKKLMSAVDEEGILRDCFVYHSASTGRWGGKLVQLQNLPKGTKTDTNMAITDINAFGYPTIEMMYPGKIMETLSDCIRGLFVPAKGKEMYVVDYGAIEARVVMWLASEERGLAEFQATDAGTDEDIYVKMNRRIKNNSALTKKNDPSGRQLGKQVILGCGFGMGAKKFKATCAGYGIDVSESEAVRIVDLYRTTYYNVKNFWYDTERAMLEAFNTQDRIISQGRIKWIYVKARDAIYCKLPSGRILTYLRPKMIENKFGNMGISFMTEVTSQWVRRDTYGGLLVENITQATARDVMAYSMPRLETTGFPVLMHTHDEIVSEQPIGAGRLQEMINLMCQIPDWAYGCPIVAEGFITHRYKKG
ncbi:MAG: hypothetical protein KAU50_11445 [Candidatus Marinimicrobia bacterium]|nr:hypothetical protein [Candidatus Neomarinimicrobiota bacterium]